MPNANRNPYNPYNPAESHEEFVGRDEELEDIEYDLDLASGENPQFLNIGITGEEGAGKTSLTYRIEEMASNRDYIPVRVKLDEGMVTDEVEIFKSIFESITSQVGDEAENSFLHAIAGNFDKVVFNLKFIQAHMASEQSSQNVSEMIISDDLEKIYSKSDAPAICLIIDNAQHLADNPVLLQKINNAFESVDGYILVLSGTEETFSKIDDAFSPMARMFHKYRISAFDSVEQTRECLQKPLNAEETQLVDEATIHEVHGLTGGRPYEINLIAHYMYKRYEESDEGSIILSSDLIDDVVDQLEEWKRPVNNEVPKAIKGLSEESIETLVYSLEFHHQSRESLVEYSLLSMLANDSIDNIGEARESISESVDDLKSNDLLSGPEDKLSFSGGIYSSAFLKYYSYSKGIVGGLGFTSRESDRGIISNIFNKAINGYLIAEVDDIHAHLVRNGGKWFRHTESLVPTKNDDVYDYDTFGDSVVLSDWRILRATYGEDEFQESSVGSERKYSAFEKCVIEIQLDWLDQNFYSVIHYDGEGTIPDLGEKESPKTSRLERMGVHLIFDNEYNIVTSGWRELQNSNFNRALQLAESALEKRSVFPEAWMLSMYVNMENSEYDEAIVFADKIIGEIEGHTDAYLAKGECLLNLEKTENAMDCFESAFELDKHNPDVWANVCHNLCFHDELDLAESVATRGIECSGGNPHLKLHHAELKSKKDDFKGASELMDEVLATDKYRGDPMALAIKAEAAAELGNKEDALDYLPEGPDTAIKIYNSACVKSIAGKVDEALDDLEAAIDKDESLRTEAVEDEQLESLRDTPRYRELINMD